MRRVLALSLLMSVPLIGHVASAEEARGPAARLRAEVDEVAAGEGAEAASAEIERARELLDRAERARAAGDDGVAEALLSVVPLQIRLVRETIRAARMEATAADVERRSLEAEQQARAARDRLEQVLERLLALSVGRPFE